LQGKSIGIIGVGNVGSRVASKCSALRMEVRLNDPPLARQSGDAKYRPIEELFDCDFVTMHTPLTFEGIDKTFHLADESFFKSLKSDCVFLNTARGAVVDTVALKSAIRFSKPAAVVLDVWENEPDIDVELLEMVDIGTPHIAGYSLDGKVAGMIMIYKAVCEYFGLKPECEVDTFLPEPKVPQLKISCEGQTEQDILLETVSRIYDIMDDDAALRPVLSLPPGKKCAFFSRLRKDYPVRREFQNTQVLVDDCNGELAKKLQGIGFKV